MAFSFNQKVKILVRLLLHERGVLTALISQRAFGYLLDEGWFNSFNCKEPINEKLDPIPWVTYPMLDFLNPRLVNNQLELLEFGSGNSTLFFAKRLGHVTTIEHDIEWYDRLKQKLPGNVEMFHFDSERSGFISSISNIKHTFDIIFIDGIHRVECCYFASNHLKEGGVVILDDSERVEYTEGIDCLIKDGFNRLDFWGISPGYLYKKNTTVFYKDCNCFKI